MLPGSYAVSHTVGVGTSATVQKWLKSAPRKIAIL